MTFLKLPPHSVDAASAPLREIEATILLSFCPVAAVSYLLPTGVPVLVHPLRCVRLTLILRITATPTCPTSDQSESHLFFVPSSEIRTLVTVLGLKTNSVQRSHSLHHDPIPYFIYHLQQQQQQISTHIRIPVTDDPAYVAVRSW
jgi:hypothetical protein